MPTATISRASATKCRVVLAGDEGLIDAFEANLLTPRAKTKLSKLTGIPEAAIAKAALDVTGDVKSVPVEIPYSVAGAVASGPFQIVLRGMQETLEAGKVFTAVDPQSALQQALASEDYPGAEPVLQWDGLDRLCCLDVDYHAIPFESRPSVAQLNARAAMLQPRAVFFHTSHGRGCKLYFVEREGFTARELAAVAAVAWLNQDARASCDLVRISRHPAYARPGYPDCGPVVAQTPSVDLSAVAAWLQRSADPEAVEEWLENHGYHRGQKLEHDECPIAPGASHGTPVLIGDEGIYCHKCASTGAGLGRKPGFVPWCSIVGGAPPRAASMIKHATHWAHARLILRGDTKLPESVLEPAYVAAVKMEHGPDSDAARAVRFAGADMIRMAGRWVSPDGATTYAQNVTGMIGELPAVWYPGSREVNAARRDLFQNAGDLSHYGYPPVSPVHGAAIWGKHLDYPDGRIAFATPASWCRNRNAPRYVEKADRMPLAEAWKLLEVPFPGLNRAYVQMLIAMKGLAEGGGAQAPFILATGPASSAKSATAHIAASICGDVASEPNFAASSERLLQAIGEGLDKGSFVVLNEVFKTAQREKLKPKTAIDPILTLTPSTVSHRMYIGPRPLGRLPALLLTDIDVPIGVRGDAQLGRRLVLVEQTARVEWHESVASCGFGEPAKVRLWSPEAAAACDAVLSHVTDTFFREPMTVKQIAAELGFKTLEESGGGVELREILRRFFFAVLDAPNLSGNDAKRLPAAGWKKISRADTGELVELWDEISNGSSGEDWQQSRDASAEDWSNRLGCTAGPISLDIRGIKSDVYVRFRIGSCHKDLATWTSANGSPLPEGVTC